MTRNRIVKIVNTALVSTKAFFANWNSENVQLVALESVFPNEMFWLLWYEHFHEHKFTSERFTHIRSARVSWMCASLRKGLQTYAFVLLAFHKTHIQFTWKRFYDLWWIHSARISCLLVKSFLRKFPQSKNTVICLHVICCVFSLRSSTLTTWRTRSTNFCRSLRTKATDRSFTPSASTDPRWTPSSGRLPWQRPHLHAETLTWRARRARSGLRLWRRRSRDSLSHPVYCQHKPQQRRPLHETFDAFTDAERRGGSALDLQRCQQTH